MWAPALGSRAVLPDGWDALCIPGGRRAHEPVLQVDGQWRCGLCSRPGTSAASFDATWCYGMHLLLARIHASLTTYVHAGHEEFYFCAVWVVWTGATRGNRLEKEGEVRAAEPYDRNKRREGHVARRNGSGVYRGPAAPVPQGLEARLLAEWSTSHAARRDFVDV